ncbi:sulfotransferase [Parafrankia sp. EUN1f]|uniref:sulfotransferase n=1 Tax=Parafrankia sp. EUN1f TaxID=102897 RepID=UPI0001C467F2|nr:sulfotransferase [Parafrankia sp. EUN1f]EFC81029.1 sulfotransferase [Parafrankia sp. EUN1f]
MGLPDFAVIGAPDAGASGLHAALARHPGLVMSRPAEPGFFLAAGVRPTAGGPAPSTGGDAPDPMGEEPFVWCRSDYEALFPGSDRRPRGECTPYYLADFPAQRRMHELLPYLRMVVVLRDPVERAYANWSAQRRAGLEHLPTLIEALDAEAARRAAGWRRRWWYAEHGRYGIALQRLYTLFPPSQVLLVRYRDLVTQPESVLREVFSFVGAVDPGAPPRGVDRMFPPAVTDAGGTRIRAAGPATTDAMAAALTTLREWSLPGPPLPPGLRARVIDRYVDDIALLARVTGRSFDEWLERGDCALETHR